MKRVKFLVFKGVAQIACQSERSDLGNVGWEFFFRKPRFSERLDNSINMSTATLRRSN